MATSLRYLDAGEQEQETDQQQTETEMNSLFSRDVQVRSLQQTVQQAEQHLGQVCQLLGSYTRKTARLRDKADLLVSHIYSLSSSEDQEVQQGLRSLAEDMSMVQDCRQAQVERLESRVVSPLRAYGDIIKTKRAEVKKLSSDLSRELKELQKTEKIRLKNPADRQTISQAEVDAQKASTNAQRCVRQMEETVTEFQRQKLEDVKRIFSDFVTVEMLFHAKALEIYSHTHHNLQSMDVHKDLELFSGRLRLPGDHLSSPLGSGRYLSPAQSVRSTLAPPPGHTHSHRLERQRGVEEEEEEEEDEEDEEEEEEEEEEEQHVIRQSYAAQFTQRHRWQK